MRPFQYCLTFTLLIVICTALQSCSPSQQVGPGQLSFVTDKLDYKLMVETTNGSFESFPYLQGDIIKYDWSPDGKKIVFEDFRNHHDSDISVINTDGSGDINLTNSPDIYEQQPNWSPDGKRIIYVLNQKDRSNIYMMNSDGSSNIQLTNNASVNVNPDWSPDGKYIVFTSTRNSDKMGIYRMKTDGSDVTQIADNGSEPSWSPDGKKIAFVRYLYQDPISVGTGQDQIVQNPEIFIMNSDGTGQKQLTYNPDYDINPVWSLDSKKIAFVSSRKGDAPSAYLTGESGNTEIYVMNADGTEQTKITDNGYFDISPNWKP